jgi:hypothetical protein
MKAPAKRDPRGAHIRLYHDIFDSPAWRALSPSDQRCYLALLRQLMSFNNGDLSLPMSKAKHSGIRSENTLAKGLRALQAVGFIAITRKGGCTRGGQRMPNLYRLTDQDSFEFPAKFVAASKATNEWKNVTSISMGKALIRAAEESAAREREIRKSPNVVMLPAREAA